MQRVLVLAVLFSLQLQMYSFVCRQVPSTNLRLVSKHKGFKEAVDYVNSKRISIKNLSKSKFSSLSDYHKNTIQPRLADLNALFDTYNKDATKIIQTKSIALKDSSIVKIQSLVEYHKNTIQPQLSEFSAMISTKAGPLVDTMTDVALDFSDKALKELEVLSEKVPLAVSEAMKNFPSDKVFKMSNLLAVVVGLSALRVVTMRIKAYALRQLVAVASHVLKELKVEVHSIQPPPPVAVESELPTTRRLILTTLKHDNDKDDTHFPRPLRRIKHPLKNNNTEFSFYSPEDISSPPDNNTSQEYSYKLSDGDDSSPPSQEYSNKLSDRDDSSLSQEYSYDDNEVSPVITDRDESPFIYDDFEQFDENKRIKTQNSAVDIMVWRD